MEKKQTAKATVEIPITCPHCKKKLTAKAERRFLSLEDAMAFKHYLNVYGIQSRARFNNLKITRTKANK